jgi:hypothetical protein
MKKIVIFCISVLLCLLIGGGILAKDNKKPKVQPNNPVMQAFMDRQSTMSFTDQKINPRDLSNILWAAAGINRPVYDDDGNILWAKTKLTIPSAMNLKPVMIFAVLDEAVGKYEPGIYKYDPIENELVLVRENNADYPGIQPNLATTPLHLIFVADMNVFSTYPDPARENRISAAAISIGCAAQDVYLYCAATKKLGAHYFVGPFIAQWVGYLGLNDETLYPGEQIAMGGMAVGYPTPPAE